MDRNKSKIKKGLLNIIRLIKPFEKSKNYPIFAVPKMMYQF